MEIGELQKKVIEFRDARDWARYHKPKDMAILLSFAVAGLGAPSGKLYSLLQGGSAFANGFGPIKWRGDHAVARENEGG